MNFHKIMVYPCMVISENFLGKKWDEFPKETIYFQLMTLPSGYD